MLEPEGFSVICSRPSTCVLRFWVLSNIFLPQLSSTTAATSSTAGARGEGRGHSVSHTIRYRYSALRPPTLPAVIVALIILLRATSVADGSVGSIAVMTVVMLAQWNGEVDPYSALQPASLSPYISSSRLISIPVSHQRHAIE